MRLFSIGSITIQKHMNGVKTLVFESKYFNTTYQLNYEPEFGKDGFKTHVLHHPIRDCHINILLKIQYILLHLIISQ